MKIERKRIKPEVGMETLVGHCYESYPYPSGNCFWFNTSTPLSDYFSGIKCVNMYSENLKEANKRFNLWDEGGLEVDIYDDVWVVVIDARIPKEWLNRAPCHICSSGCDSETFKEIVDVCDKIGGIGERYVERKPWKIAELEDGTKIEFFQTDISEYQTGTGFSDAIIEKKPIVWNPAIIYAPYKPVMKVPKDYKPPEFIDERKNDSI